MAADRDSDRRERPAPPMPPSRPPTHERGRDDVAYDAPDSHGGLEMKGEDPFDPRSSDDGTAG